MKVSQILRNKMAQLPTDEVSTKIMETEHEGYLSQLNKNKYST